MIANLLSNAPTVRAVFSSLQLGIVLERDGWLHGYFVAVTAVVAKASALAVVVVATVVVAKASALAVVVVVLF